MRAPRVTVLTGGVGGAKLVLGLCRVIEPSSITAVVNTGDDFRHLGQWVSPDIDSLIYALTGRANTVQGWGREGETWTFMEVLRSLRGEDWFALGDGDLALHIYRTLRLAAGEPLSAVTADVARAWGVQSRVLPVTDDVSPTTLDTDEGVLDFQHYFVRRRCEPKVRSIDFPRAASARPAPGVLEAIRGDEVDVVLIAPSNPYLSIDPILAIPGIRSALEETKAPVIAITPIVGGKAVKGPTAKLMEELGVSVTPATVAAHYAGWIHGMLLDERDPHDDLPIATASADTLMSTLEDRERVAQAALALARRLPRHV